MQPTSPKRGEAKWLDVARRELGQREIYGKRHNPRILEYGTAVRMKVTTDEVAWCSNFVNWVLKQVDIEGTHSAAAISWATWGVPLDEPKVGCVAVVPRKDDKNPHAAHVGFVIAYTEHAVMLLAGNQGNSVSIRAFARKSVKHYRWPIEELGPAA